jgi:Reeler domain
MRIILTVALLLICRSAHAFSGGSPICEVNTLPLVQMSPELSDPPPTGWFLAPERASYVPGATLRVAIGNTDPSKKARGVLIWAKTGPTTGAGSFELPSNGLFQYLPAFADCGQWALSHASAVAKTQTELQFTWSAPPSGPLIMRAFLIEDCAAPGGCRAHQALTDVVLLQEALFVNGFELAQ